jgi:hypothetical protein
MWSPQICLEKERQSSPDIFEHQFIPIGRKWPCQISPVEGLAYPLGQLFGFLFLFFFLSKEKVSTKEM